MNPTHYTGTPEFVQITYFLVKFVYILYKILIKYKKDKLDSKLIHLIAIVTTLGAL